MNEIQSETFFNLKNHQNTAETDEESLITSSLSSDTNSDLYSVDDVTYMNSLVEINESLKTELTEAKVKLTNEQIYFKDKIKEIDEFQQKLIKEREYIFKNSIDLGLNEIQEIKIMLIESGLIDLSQKEVSIISVIENLIKNEKNV